MGCHGRVLMNEVDADIAGHPLAETGVTIKNGQV